MQLALREVCIFAGTPPPPPPPSASCGTRQLGWWLPCLMSCCLPGIHKSGMATQMQVP